MTVLCLVNNHSSLPVMLTLYTQAVIVYGVILMSFLVILWDLLTLRSTLYILYLYFVEEFILLVSRVAQYIWYIAVCAALASEVNSHTYYYYFWSCLIVMKIYKRNLSDRTHLTPILGVLIDAISAQKNEWETGEKQNFGSTKKCSVEWECFGFR